MGLTLTGIGIGALGFLNERSGYFAIFPGLFGIGTGLGVKGATRIRNVFCLVNVARATLGVAILGSIFGG
jgi:hypothetical protein